MKRSKSIALGMAMAVTLTACGGNAAAPASQETSAATAAEAQMGRWVESEVDLEGRVIAGYPTLLDDGSLVMYVYVQDPTTFETGALVRLTSTDNGENWTEEDPGWSEQVDGFISQVWSAPDGTVCLGSVVRGENSRADNRYSLYLQAADGTLEPLDIDEADAVQSAVFYQNDLLLFMVQYGQEGSTQEMMCYDRETGEEQTITLGGTAVYGGGVEPTVAGDQLLYLYYDETGNVPLLKLDIQSGNSTQVLESLSEAISPNALVGDADGAVYYPTPKGIYRLASGGTLPEQIMAADGMAMSVSSNYPNSICRAANGDFLVTMLGDDSTHRMYRYHYDDSLPTQAETTLTVWSLEDSQTTRAAINQYKQQHPEVDVTFTVAIPEDTQDPSAARNDALTQLNTELLAGEGPDLLILDGVDYQNYADKGLLADLSDTLPVSDLQANLANPFVEDGKVYVMPARFSVPVLIGDEGSLEGLNDLSALQQAVLDAAPRPDFGDQSSDYYETPPEDQRYALCMTNAKQFADFLLPVCGNAILQGNTLDESALREVMTFVQTVSDYYDIRNYTLDNNTGSAQSWTGTDIIEINPEQGEYTDSGHALYGWFSMKTPFSVLAMARREDTMDYSSDKVSCEMMLRPGLTQGAYIPQVLVGVNANGTQLDAAKQLAAAFFDSAVQETYYGDGMTVRADSLQEKLDSVVNNEQYEKSAFHGDVQSLLESCTTPVLVPAVLEESFIDHVDAVIQGQETVDDAVNGIKSDLSLYLAEQQ